MSDDLGMPFWKSYMDGKVLITKDQDDEGKPAITVSTLLEGVSVKQTQSFNDNDAGWAERDSIFNDNDCMSAMADKLVAFIIKAMEMAEEADDEDEAAESIMGLLQGEEAQASVNLDKGEDGTRSVKDDE
jgi:hypothetical protein